MTEIKADNVVYKIHRNFNLCGAKNGEITRRTLAILSDSLENPLA